jgi:hypothetical protein
MLPTIIATAFTAVVLHLLYKFFGKSTADISHFPLINPPTKRGWFSLAQDNRFNDEALSIAKEGQKKVNSTPHGSDSRPR